MSEIRRLARSLARCLTYAAHPLDGGGVTPQEREALDRVMALAAKVQNHETVARCEGEQDQDQRPACHGFPIRIVTFNPPPGSFVSGPMGARWCPECIEKAGRAGYHFIEISDVIAPPPSSYRCRNLGCKRRVRREGEYCSRTCTMEAFGETTSSLPPRGY